MTGWSENDIPDLRGRRAIVTGGNSGLGLEVVRALCAHGAEVTIACRDAARGAAAVRVVNQRVPHARVHCAVLDLADLRSIETFAGDAGDVLDLLVNNAGVMANPVRAVTKDGFEMQFGTNHLGHFALTGRLLPALLRAAAPSRVVTVSSIAHLPGKIRLDDLQWERGYSPRAAYSQSKLANLMFALELQRRLTAHGMKVSSMAAHPGVSYTNLFGTMMTGRGAFARAAADRIVRLLAQSAQRGALPLLMAATSPAVRGGAYIGPDGFREMRGNPADAVIAPQARDPAVAAELWRRSEELSGVKYLD